MAAGQSVVEKKLAQLSQDAFAAMDAHHFEVAEETLRSLIQLQQRALGPEHADTLKSQTSLASALGSLQRYREAEAIMREVLQVQQQSPAFGMEHKSTLYSVKALDYCLLAQDRFKEAEPMLRSVHALDVRVLGPRHVETLSIQTTVGKCLVGDNRLEEAEGLLRGVLEGYQAVDQAQAHAQQLPRFAVGFAMLDLSDCLVKSSKHAEAELLIRAAVKEARYGVGENHPITIRCMARHATVLGEMGKHAAAEVMYRLAVPASSAVLGWEDPQTARRAHQYAKCLVDQHKWEAAEALVRDTLSHLQQALGEGHPTVLEWMRELAQLLQRQSHHSKRSEAKALLRRARDLARNKRG